MSSECATLRSLALFCKLIILIDYTKMFFLQQNDSAFKIHSLCSQLHY